MRIENHKGRPKKYDFRLEPGEYREVPFTKSARDIAYKTAKKLGYKVVTRIVVTDGVEIMQIERPMNDISLTSGTYPQ